jgi:uncharacterized protein YukE
MSAFKVNSSAIRAFADGPVENAYGDIADGKTYVHANGDFSFYQMGAIGYLAGAHQQLIEHLDSMFGQVQTVLERSKEALLNTASSYDHTDQRAAAKVDSTYPAAPRPPVTRN